MLTVRHHEDGTEILESVSTDRRVLGIPVQDISIFVLERESHLADQLRRWHFHRVWYEADRAVEVYCRWLPLALVLRLYDKARGLYRRCLRALYWVGLIDLREGDMFTWGDFYRIKSQ